MTEVLILLVLAFDQCSLSNNFSSFVPSRAIFRSHFSFPGCQARRLNHSLAPQRSLYSYVYCKRSANFHFQGPAYPPKPGTNTSQNFSFRFKSRNINIITPTLSSFIEIINTKLNITRCDYYTPSLPYSIQNVKLCNYLL